MSSLSIFAHDSPDAIIAYRRGRGISIRRFLADARALADALPPTDHIINACADRYRFAVGFAACLLSGRASLLPPSHVARMLEQLKDFADDAVVLADTEQRELNLPVAPFPTLDESPIEVTPASSTIPEIPADQLAAWVFTSGSTGDPQPHRKHWGLLRRNVANEARALGLTAERPITLIGTVPPQHMYGFESTVLLAWLSGGAFEASRPFYPADVAETLKTCPGRAMLVTTPFHLENILDTDLELPAVDSLLCATSPLSLELAERAESAFRAQLFEIYGSTETGQLATRRTATDTAWTLFPEVRLQDHDGQTWAQGGHVEVPVPLGDIIEQVDERRFRLLGRRTDLVNVAGKRTSLGWLNQQLLSIDGIEDGLFYLPELAPAGGDPGVERLTAFVVAPELGADRILSELRTRIDPVFLPRPLILLDALPRNSVGKMLQTECEALLAQHARDRSQPTGKSR